jgi:hypothetical protein
VAHTLAMRARELTGTEAICFKAFADAMEVMENVLLCDIILHTTAANADTSIVLALSVAVAQFSCEDDHEN